MREKRYHPPGLPPGTLTPLAGAIVPKGIHVIHYTPDAVEFRRKGWLGGKAAGGAPQSKG